MWPNPQFIILSFYYRESYFVVKQHDSQIEWDLRIENLGAK